MPFATGPCGAQSLNDASFIAVKIIQSARDLAENRPVIFWQTSPAVLITEENVDNFPDLW